MAIAHGYWKMAGRPMAVGLHDTVGMLHASMALFNAWADRAALMALIGTGPLDSSQRRPWIDWVHTLTDQGSVVRDFTVWNDQPTSLPALMDSVVRGWETIARPPTGPGVISLDVFLQEMALDGAVATPQVRQPGRIGPDPDQLLTLVDLLATSKAPLFLTDRPLTPDGAQGLLDVAESYGAGLVELGGGASFPVGHPHDLTENRLEALDRADLVIALDVRDVSWGLGEVDLATRSVSSPDGLREIVSIGLAPATQSSWMVTASNGPCGLAMMCDVALALNEVRRRSVKPARPLDPVFAELAARPAPRPPTQDELGRVHPGAVGEILFDALQGREFTVANGNLSGWALMHAQVQNHGSVPGTLWGRGAWLRRWIHRWRGARSTRNRSSRCRVAGRRRPALHAPSTVDCRPPPGSLSLSRRGQRLVLARRDSPNSGGGCPWALH